MQSKRLLHGSCLYENHPSIHLHATCFLSFCKVTGGTRSCQLGKRFKYMGKNVQITITFSKPKPTKSFCLCNSCFECLETCLGAGSRPNLLQNMSRPSRRIQNMFHTEQFESISRGFKGVLFEVLQIGTLVYLQKMLQKHQNWNYGVETYIFKALNQNLELLSRSHCWNFKGSEEAHCPSTK